MFYSNCTKSWQIIISSHVNIVKNKALLPKKWVKRNTHRPYVKKICNRNLTIHTYCTVSKIVDMFFQTLASQNVLK